MDRIGPRKPPRLYVREWMKEKGVDQRRLAERLDCKEATVSRLLSGKMQMTMQWLAGFAEALDVAITDFYRDPKRPTPNDLFAQIPADKQDAALSYLHFLATGTDRK